jgi:hypothetical protein
MITITVDDSRIVAKLERFTPNLQRGLLRVISAAVIDLQRHIVADKLQGQVLGHRTGNLQRAILGRPAQVQGNAVIGRVVVDSTAPYGIFHEYGVAHPWTIRARPGGVLAFNAGGEMVFRRQVTHPGLRERSFMRSGLADRRDDIIRRIRGAVGEAMQGAS